MSKNAVKRTLAALVLSGGAAVSLIPGVAHAQAPAAATADDSTTMSGVGPVVERVTGVVDNPSGAVKDTQTAVGVAAQATGSATKATQTSLSGAGGALQNGLPNAPKVD
ncbi:hypothetical protein [Streptomyces sp. NPDC089799]|uniref:hypothetical protein n=1 Tax=Streptomyces sp. NPDC089799 TaxID=3155066 RepID=UPI00341EA856